MLIESLKQRSAELEDIIRRAQSDLENAPEGFLRASSSHGKTQFYHRKNASDKHGEYLAQTNSDLFSRLAQKEYASRVLYLATRQKRAIDNLINNQTWGFESHSIAALYSSMPPLKRSLVDPLELPDADYAEAWQAQTFTRKAICNNSTAFYTEKNERVRSKSEIIIANMLFRNGICYHYEKPLELESGLVIHPDFTVLNSRTRQEFVWEHFGMMDDDEYREQALNRINIYQQSGFLHGINLITTHETAQRPLGTKTVELMIHAYLA